MLTVGTACAFNGEQAGHCLPGEPRGWRPQQPSAIDSGALLQPLPTQLPAPWHPRVR